MINAMPSIPWYLQSQHSFDLADDFRVDHHPLPVYIPPHRHDFIEIEWVVGGSGRTVLNGVEHRLRRGSLSLLLPWHIHEIDPTPDDPLDIYKCSFSAQLFLDRQSPFFELNDLVFRDMDAAPLVHLVGGEYEAMAALFRDLLGEHLDFKPWKEPLLKARTAEILIRFDRARRATGGGSSRSKGRKPDMDMWEVIGYIHSNYRQDITLEDLAQKVHYSAAVINRKLKQFVGLNFEDVLQEVRIRNASAFLAYPDISIADIARLVGYRTPETFYRAFRSVKGLSPANFRKLTAERGQNANLNPTLTALNAQIVYFLHQHYAEKMSLGRLAQEFHYSEDYLADALAQTGASFTTLLHEIRVYHARAMLLTSNMPVNEIGFMVGFDSAKTFYRVFKQIHGLAPGQYRKEAAGAQAIDPTVESGSASRAPIAVDLQQD